METTKCVVRSVIVLGAGGLYFWWAVAAVRWLIADQRREPDPNPYREPPVPFLPGMWFLMHGIALLGAVLVGLLNLAAWAWS